MGQAAENRAHDLATLYELDLCAWVEVSAALLRDDRRWEIDAAHLAEGLEDLGKSERRSLRSYLRNLIVPLLKWQYQPERRSTSWERSILNARNEIEDILAESPSLAPELPEYVERVYGVARKLAAGESGRDVSCFPTACPYRTEQLRTQDFRPHA